MELTAKQEKALIFIRDVAEDVGTPPTLRELCEFMGYSSIGSAQDVVAALRKKGYLQNHATQRARALLVTDKGLQHGRQDDGYHFDDDNTFAIPCLGQIPAGNPVEAIAERVGVLRLSKSLLPKVKPDGLYALQASGLSMINAGICDGDWLVVESTEEAKKGQIVVAELEGEATVKRLEQDPRGWFLKPENPDFSPIYACDVLFKVVGRVVALQRAMI